MSSKALLSIQDVSYCFSGASELAVDGICAEIKSGEMTGLVGPDGAGKSSLMRLMAGLLVPTKGIITVDGLNTITDAQTIRRFMGYMPQKFGLYEELTVLENLRLYAELRQLSPEVREVQFKKLLTFTDLARFQHRLAGKLSGGMKQKLGLACAMMGQPKLLLLDEPSVGVDPISRRELWTMVQQLLHEGLAVVWSTAYLDEAERCDAVILLNQGKTLFVGSPDEFLKRTEGRSELVGGIESRDRRQILMKILNSPAVGDAVIQGKMIRVVLKDAKQRPLINTLSGALNAYFERVPTRFEDAFIDSLGGAGGGVSALAEHIIEKPPYDKPVIEANHLSKVFGQFTAVSDNHFAIYRGEIFGLLGPNGAGKSTTFKMMCGLLQPTSGTASVMGLDLRTSSSRARNRIGYMAQKFSLYGHLTIEQNLRFFSGLYGLSGVNQQQQITSMIDIFDFKPLLKQKAFDLPLGFKQRLALACAVIHQPDILFLDEPTSGVDPLTRREFWTHINGMVEKGVTVMVTTHFMDEAEYCDRIALIYKSKNIASGTPDELKDSVRTQALPNPSLEDAFIQLIAQHDSESA